MPQFDMGSDLKAEFDSLRPGESTEQGASRRTALKTALGVGYAAAALPILAQTAITNDADGLKAGEVKYAGRPSAGLSRRAGRQARTFPVVLVVQEIFGVHEHIKDVCRRLAKLGLPGDRARALRAPGRRLEAAPNREIMAEVVAKVPDAQVMSDLDATSPGPKATAGRRRQARASPASAGAAASSGSTPRTTRTLKAGVAWYGRLVGEPSATAAEAPARPRRRRSRRRCSASTAAQDQGIPLDTVEQMKAALATASRRQAVEIVVYPDAPHGFHADYRPSYRKRGRGRLEAAAGVVQENGVA